MIRLANVKIYSISECKNIHKIYCILFRKTPRSTSGLLQMASPSRSSKFPQILFETVLKWYFRKTYFQFVQR